MRIPKDLAPWSEAIEEAKDGPRITENIGNEKRIDKGTAGTFWERLRHRFDDFMQSGGTLEYESAIGFMIDSIYASNRQDSLFLKGGIAQHDEKRLCRFEAVKARHFDLEFLRQNGLVEANDVRLAAQLAEESLNIQSTRIGKPEGIAWAFFREDLDPSERELEEMLATLGLKIDKERPSYVLWEYELDHETTHCPTVLDAQDDASFEPTDPSESTGKTRAREGVDGVREVVHQSVNAKIRKREVYYLQPEK